MRYDDFKAAWTRALRDSGLPTIGWPTETMDLASMDRRYSVSLLPHGGQESEPFHVTAALKFTWNALQTARTATTEEDMLTELFGREEAQDLDTERPWLRVDVKLHASLEYGKAIQMPAKSALREWAREVTARLERIEPLLPEEIINEAPGGALEVRGWKGDPELHVTCDAEGVLKLDSIELAGWQAVLLPRHWDDPERSDEGPEQQLSDMFARLKLAVRAWMESLDHLCPATVK